MTIFNRPGGVAPLAPLDPLLLAVCVNKSFSVGWGRFHVIMTWWEIRKSRLKSRTSEACSPVWRSNKTRTLLAFPFNSFCCLSIHGYCYETNTILLIIFCTSDMALQVAIDLFVPLSKGSTFLYNPI